MKLVGNEDDVEKFYRKTEQEKKALVTALEQCAEKKGQFDAWKDTMRDKVTKASTEVNLCLYVC